MVGGMFPNASNNDPGSCPRPGLVGIERGNLTFFFSSSGALVPDPVKTARRFTSFHKFPTVPTSDRNKISFDSTRLRQMPLSQNQNRREKRKRSDLILTSSTPKNRGTPPPPYQAERFGPIRFAGVRSREEGKEEERFLEGNGRAVLFPCRRGV
jgi:hypothetical protein